LPIQPAGLAADDVDEHQAAPERCGEREPEDATHWNVQQVHDARLHSAA
jgi:hypothetical protein